MTTEDEERIIAAFERLAAAQEVTANLIASLVELGAGWVAHQVETAKVLRGAEGTVADANRPAAPLPEGKVQILGGDNAPRGAAMPLPAGLGHLMVWITPDAPLGFTVTHIRTGRPSTPLEPATAD